MQRGVRLFGAAIIRIWARVRIEGEPDWDALGVVILAPNHCSFADPVILQRACGRHLTFLMTDAVHRIWWMRWFFNLWSAIPVPEAGPSSAALKAALGALAEGRSVAIFPEGRISTDGRVQSGRGGVGFLARKAGVSVIPVAVLGSFTFLPKSARWPRRTTLVVRYGEPVAPPTADVENAAYARCIMDALVALGAPPAAAQQDE